MPKIENVNIGVIGAGWWATRAHIPGILKHPYARLHSVQSRKLADAEKIAKDFGAAYAFEDYNELLKQPDLHAVVVSSTPHLHYPQAKAALERGLHVLIEKPMTIRAAEAAGLVALAEKRGLQIIIGCTLHYTPHAAEAQRIIQAGELGRIKMISILMTNPMHELLRGTSTSPTPTEVTYKEPEKGSYSDPAIAGGGHIYCQIPHVAAYVTFLTGTRATQVFARFDNDGSPMDIYDSLNISLERGELVSIASTGAIAMTDCSYEIRVFGTSAILLMELWKGTMEVVGMDGQRKSFPTLLPEQIYPEHAPVHNLIDTVRDGAPNRSPGTLGLAAMEVIEAACESAKSGKNVVIRDVG